MCAAIGGSYRVVESDNAAALCAVDMCHNRNCRAQKMDAH